MEQINHHHHHRSLTCGEIFMVFEAFQPNDEDLRLDPRGRHRQSSEAAAAVGGSTVPGGPVGRRLVRVEGDALPFERGSGGGGGGGGSGGGGGVNRVVGVVFSEHRAAVRSPLVTP